MRKTQEQCISFWKIMGGIMIALQKNENNKMPKGREVNWCAPMWLNYCRYTTVAAKYINL